jgi:hypothetical protein
MNLNLELLAGAIGAVVIFASPRVKQLIDLIRMGWPSMPPGAPPILALGIGVLVSLLVIVAVQEQAPFWLLALAAAVFAGIAIASDAMGQTTGQDQAREARDKRGRRE